MTDIAARLAEIDTYVAVSGHTHGGGRLLEWAASTIRDLAAKLAEAQAEVAELKRKLNSAIAMGVWP